MASREPVTRIPVVLCVDVEPDDFYVDRRDPKPWRGFEALHPEFRDLRAKLEARTGHDVHFCWCIRMDAQIALAHGRPAWAVEQYGPFFEEYRRAGDAIGSHVHTYRWSDSIDNWIDGFDDDDWVAECVAMAAKGHADAFGEQASVIRFGVFWSSTSAINCAERLGYRFDLTVEPGLPPNFSDVRKPAPTADLPDYYRVPREPYAPSRADFRRRAEHEHRAMTIIPLTSSYEKLGVGFRSLTQRLQRMRRNGFRNRRMSVPLSMWRPWEGKNSFGAMLDRAIAAQPRPYLAFAVHSNFPVTRSRERVRSALAALLAHPASSRFVFCTPPELMAMHA
jgi:hypothetical protein